MKQTLALLLVLLAPALVFAQTQPNYAAQISAANPSIQAGLQRLDDESFVDRVMRSRLDSFQHTRVQDDQLMDEYALGITEPTPGAPSFR